MSTTLSIENPLKGGVSSDNNLDVRRLDAFAAAQEYRQRRADEPPVQDARAWARAAKLEAANVRELAKAVKRVLDHGHAFTYAHQTPSGEAVYLKDPDGNGLELYYDGPREQWTDEEGKPLFDIDLIKEMDPKGVLEELGPT